MVEQWPLTGRDEELRIVVEALDVPAHRGIVIAGAAGVGKSRLARAAVETATAQGWSVRRVAGTSTGRPVTLGAFARWADDADGAPLALSRKVFSEFTAGTDGKPLMVFVDDAHLLDDMSALIVHQLVLQDVAAIVATIRSGESAPDAVTALWKDNLVRRLELQPLSRNESSTLVRTVLGGSISAECEGRMWRLSRGNVLFLNHLVQHDVDSGALSCTGGEWRWTGKPSASPSLVELVEQQIGSVPDDVLDVVDLVALAEPVDRAVLAALAEPQSIEAAEQRGLIAAGIATDAISAGHPLYGEIRLSQCGPLRLRRLRGQLARAMADHPAVDPLRLGLLWLESDLPPDPAVLLRAARISGSRLDLGLAERLARAAVDAYPSAATKLALAYILVTRAGGAEAEQLLDSLAPDELSVPGLVDGVILRAANHLFLLGNTAGAREVLDEAIRIGDTQRNHGLLTFRAVGEVMAADPVATLDTMTGVDYTLLDDFGRVLGYAAETIAHGDLGHTASATRAATEGYRVLAESPLEAFHGTGLAEFHAYALLAAGYVADADAAAEREVRRCADMPGMSRPLAIAALGMTALARGDLAAALRHLGSASGTLGDDSQIFVPFYRFGILYTEALARAGDVAAAAEALEHTSRGRHPAYEYVESGYLLAEAWVSAVQGQLARAREKSWGAAKYARLHGQPTREVLCLQVAVQFGSLAVTERLDELSTMVEGPRAPLAARYAHALADDDGDGLDTVSRDFEAMGDRLAAADAAAQASNSHRLAGRRGSALTASARARSLASACGGAVSPALTAAEVPLPFTRREHEIAQLLAQGKSNRAIAEAMSLSIRTVQGHIYQASSKAGVTSRSELAALVEQFNEQ